MATNEEKSQIINWYLYQNNKNISGFKRDKIYISEYANFIRFINTLNICINNTNNHTNNELINWLIERGLDNEFLHDLIIIESNTDNKIIIFNMVFIILLVLTLLILYF